MFYAAGNFESRYGGNDARLGSDVAKPFGTEPTAQSVWEQLDVEVQAKSNTLTQ